MKLRKIIRTHTAPDIIAIHRGSGILMAEVMLGDIIKVHTEVSLKELQQIADVAKNFDLIYESL